MLDVKQRAPKDRPSSLAQWVYDAIGQPEVSLRVRLRGNNLHILCESRQSLEAQTVVNLLLKALQVQQGAAKLPIDPGNPIYQIIIYGRIWGQQRPEWIKQIRLKLSPHQDAKVSQTTELESFEATTTGSALLISHENLARSGSPEAIARYLSETLSPLGVSVKVLIQGLPNPPTPTSRSDQLGAMSTQLKNSATGNSHHRRLWVISHSNYSPDPSLLAEPVVQKLRSLQLKGFRDAAICSQVRGEAAPEWMLRVDLTPKEEMLKDWARWGDVQAIALSLNQALREQGMEVRAVLKDVTLHIFCHLVVAKQTPGPDQPTTVSAIAPLLQAIAPQGIQAATIYGVESQGRSRNPEQETPLWIDWLNLPAAENLALAESTYALAQQGNQEAITFLLQRLLNPNLEQRLVTGGIQVKICRKQDLLHIMSEAPICPPQAQVGPPITRFLRQIAIPEIAGVRIYGRRAGATSPSWNYGVDFVPRHSQVPEATPEFAASDAYVHELVAPTEEPQEPTELTQDDVKDGQAIEVTINTIQRWLCYSQLFVTTEENLNLAIVAQRHPTKSFSPSLGIRVAVIWAAVGLLLTMQADWLIGQVLRFKAKPTSVVATDAAPVPMSLPELSLQKGSPQRDDFNASGFTKQGDRSVIINQADNTSNSGRVSATKAAILAAARSPHPSFNNPLLDQKLALYQQRLLQSRPPDVIIVGSSRALRGVDPIALQDALAAQGYPNLEVFNFAINGATAQVVDLMIRRILTPEQLPKLIIWADGSRAFNSSRVDATYNAIAASEGYQHLQAGTFPKPQGINQRDYRSGETPRSNSTGDKTPQNFNLFTVSYQSISDQLNKSLASISATYPQRDQLKSLLRQQFVELFPQTNIPQEQSSTPDQKLSSDQEFLDLDGFLPMSLRFNPTTYYQNHPRVTGDYDGDYQSFQLSGKQDTALEALLQFAQTHQIGIVFVNLPLTQDYLDPTRSAYEAQFQQYMRSSASQKGLIFRDLSQLLLTQQDYFSDPSHLNRYGAYKVSNQLAQDPMIPWSLVSGH